MKGKLAKLENDFMGWVAADENRTMHYCVAKEALKSALKSSPYYILGPIIAQITVVALGGKPVLWSLIAVPLGVGLFLFILSYLTILKGVKEIIKGKNPF